MCLSSAAVINCNGSVNWVGSYVDEEFCYVRPALQLTNTDASNIQIRDRFEFGNAEFEVIAKTLHSAQVILVIVLFVRTVKQTMPMIMRSLISKSS